MRAGRGGEGGAMRGRQGGEQCDGVRAGRVYSSICFRRGGASGEV